MYNKKGDFGMPLWSPIVIMVLVLTLVVFGLYFFVFTDDADWILMNDQIPKQNTLNLLLQSPMQGGLTISDGFISSYLERPIVQIESEFSWESLNKGKQECVNICDSLMKSVTDRMNTLTTDLTNRDPNWMVVTYKMPEDKLVMHLTRASHSYAHLVQSESEETDEITIHSYKTQSALVLLPGGKGSLKIYLLYK
jgi:hypothetical protein